MEYIEYLYYRSWIKRLTFHGLEIFWKINSYKFHWKNHSLAQILLSNMLSQRLPDYTSLCLFKHVKMSWSLYLDFLPFLYESIFQQKTLWCIMQYGYICPKKSKGRELGYFGTTLNDRTQRVKESPKFSKIHYGELLIYKLKREF